MEKDLYIKRNLPILNRDRNLANYLDLTWYAINGRSLVKPNLVIEQTPSKAKIVNLSPFLDKIKDGAYKVTPSLLCKTAACLAFAFFKPE